MVTNSINNKLILKNTAVLYFRMIFTLGVTLFTTRELLRILGVEDFGLYNVVGGVVMMFSFLNNAMVASSQRFISYALGEGDKQKQRQVFSTSVFIHIYIALVILLFAETIGLWFLNSKMTIPESRYIAANWVFQAAIISFVCQILSVPFSASVVAHEKMSFFAFVSILDSVLKLLIVYLLIIFDADKLKLYSVMMLGISMLNFALHLLYTRHRFSECRLSRNIDRHLYKEMLSFAGWSFVGNFGFASKDYGVNIILNIFCGPTVNAARGIAYQVMNAVNGFVINFQTAMNPQITKRYAAGEVDSMITLVKNGSRYSFYLLSIIMVPLMVRAEYVLDLWLVDVPDLALQFMRLTLVMSVVNSMHGPFVTAIQATGKIKVFQLTIASIMLLDLPISFILLKSGAASYNVMYVAIGTAFIGLIARAVLLNHLIKIGLKDYIINVVCRNIILFVLMFLASSYVSQFIPQTFWGLIGICLVSIIISTIIIYFNLSRIEKKFIQDFLKSKFIRIIKEDGSNI